MPEKVIESEPVEVPKKKKKKKRKPRKKKKKKIEMDVDNLRSQTLEEDKQFWKNNPNKNIYSYPESFDRIPDLLTITKKNLNYIKEMQKLFDSPGFSSNGTSNSFQNMSKRQANLHREYMKKFKPKKRFYFVHNEDVKIKLNDKLSMKVLRNDPANKARFFVFEASGKLASLVETYRQVKNTMDINSTGDFLQSNPYFPGALYDLGEYYRLQGNYKEANFLLEKMMFFYEDSLSYEFKIFESDLEKQINKGKSS